jgi:hypothetical protein
VFCGTDFFSWLLAITLYPSAVTTLVYTDILSLSWRYNRVQLNILCGFSCSICCDVHLWRHKSTISEVTALQILRSRLMLSSSFIHSARDIYQNEISKPQWAVPVRACAKLVQPSKRRLSNQDQWSSVVWSLPVLGVCVLPTFRRNLIFMVYVWHAFLLCFNLVHLAERTQKVRNSDFRVIHELCTLLPAAAGLSVFIR